MITTKSDYSSEPMTIPNTVVHQWHATVKDQYRHQGVCRQQSDDAAHSS